MNNSFVFYRSFAEALEFLPAEEYKAAMAALIGYALDGVDVGAAGAAGMFMALVKPQIDANNKRRENGRRGGRTNNQTISKAEANGSKAEANASKPEANVNANVNVNANEEKEIVKKKKARAFSPPTLTEVREYCRDTGKDIDADKFWNFYESKNWMVGKNKMSNWHAAVANWQRGETKKRNPQTQIQQRHYDNAELERMIFGGTG